MLALGFAFGTAVGQLSPPTRSPKGIDAKVASTIDLSPDIPGYQLRLQMVTIEPGGYGGIHSHKDRPAFSYILEGNLTDFREGGDVKVHGPGDVQTESRDVTHWAQNKGTTNVVLVHVDIIRP
jgi:quercetin dioxygenase-like cupin family protein